VVGWKAHCSASSRGASETADGDMVITEAVVFHESAGGESIEVESSRSGADGSERAERRRRTASNTVWGYVHRRPDLDASSWSDEVDRVLAEIEAGTRPWLASTIDIDGKPCEVDVVEFGLDVWAAVGEVAGVPVTVSAEGVPRDGLALGTVSSYGLVSRPPTGWRARVPRWRPKSWLTMAIANRLYEWRSWIWHNLFGQASRHRKGTIWIPHTDQQTTSGSPGDTN